MNKEIFYRVASFVTTFEQSTTHHSSLEDNHDFPVNPFMSHDEIQMVRQQAMDFYREKLSALGDGKFELPFATPSNFEMNENAAFGLTFSIVELYEDEEEFEWYLAGEEDELLEEGKTEEARIISEILIAHQ